MRNRTVSAVAFASLLLAGGSTPAVAASLADQLTAHYWHFSRDLSDGGAGAFLYADMKFHADGVWTQFYRNYLPDSSGCSKVAEDYVSFGKWQVEGGQVVITGYHRDGQYWKKPSRMQLRDGKLELVGGNTRFVAADSVAGGYGCRSFQQGEFEQHQGWTLPEG